MSATYRTKDGDMVDEIAKGYYGTLAGRIVEQVLEANQGLADYGPTLPDGVIVVLPDISAVSPDEGIALWE